jgi:hypothetical protein
MSGKSRRRGRRLSRSQRKRVGRVVSAPLTEAPAAPKAAPKPVAAPVSAAREPAPKTAVLREPPNISGELKRIGVVGGAMLLLLVVVYFVLPLFTA